MMRAGTLVALATISACGRAPSIASRASSSNAERPPPAVRSPRARTAPASQAGDAGPLDPSLLQLAGPPLAEGPIVISGYPHPIRNGWNDVGTWYGWSRDDALFGVCGDYGGRSPPVTRCEFVRADGTVEPMSSERPEPTDGDSSWDPARKKAIDAFVRDNGLLEIEEPKDHDAARVMPSPLVGRWAFTDIELRVVRIAETTKGASEELTAPASLRVGGVVTGETAVFPVVLSPALVAPGAPIMHRFSAMNGMVVSHDGAMIGMIGTFFCGEWCNSFRIQRMTTAALASLVYNDTGYRHHTRHDWRRAAQLFAKATRADPAAPLPPYNLACALSRQNDPRAAHALALAIDRGGESVKRRATTDEDFSSVRDQTWFRDAVSAASK